MLPCNTQRALLALLVLLPGPLLAQAPIVTGDCAGGASATVTSGSWGQGDQFRCTTTGDIQLGSHIEANKDSQVTLISNQIRIVAPVTIRAGANFHARTLSSLQVSDTGIWRCSSGLSPDDEERYRIDENGFGVCPKENYREQDAEYRKDRLAHTFHSHDGKEYSPAKEICFSDQTTGLMWQGKIAYSFHYSYWKDTFSWYNPDASTNGGHVGNQDPGGEGCYGRQWNEPSTYCNTHAYVARVNREGLCGFRDWRLPTVKELEGILSYERVMALFKLQDRDIYFAALPYSLSDVYRDEEEMSRVENSIIEPQRRTFWTATPSARNQNHAWFVDFIYGTSYTWEKSTRRSVRLVRGGH